MRHCPDCSFTRAWLLADGRFQCHRYRKRYRAPDARSVWNSFRIDEATQRSLPDYFLPGVPGYRLRFHGLASRPTREQFFRVVRAAMTFEEQLREPFGGLVELEETTLGGARPGKRGWGAYGKIIVFGILKRNGVVRLCPVARRTKKEVVRPIRLPTQPGSLYDTDPWQAYASLVVRGEPVVMRKERGRPKELLQNLKTASKHQ